jgi:hypothetical protein
MTAVHQGIVIAPISRVVGLLSGIRRHAGLQRLVFVANPDSANRNARA